MEEVKILSEGAVLLALAANKPSGLVADDFRYEAAVAAAQVLAYSWSFMGPSDLTLRSLRRDVDLVNESLWALAPALAAEFGAVELDRAQTAGMLGWTDADPDVWQEDAVIIPAGTCGELTGETGVSSETDDPLLEVVFDVPGRGEVQTYVYASELVPVPPSLKTALRALLTDVENACCDRGAYGMAVEDPVHPFHVSVLAARQALAGVA